MARGPKLKVFRMPIGFHDAYVAAPSQKAAAEAWGADPSVFSRGEAELVTDEALAAAPLAAPGKVIKRLRGTAEEQIAALPHDGAGPVPSKAKDKAPKPKPRPKPRPSRAALDKAEAALAEAEARQRQEEAKLAAREAALAVERRNLDRRQAEERDKLGAVLTDAEQAYEGALRRWRAEH